MSLVTAGSAHIRPSNRTYFTFGWYALGFACPPVLIGIDSPESSHQPWGMSGRYGRGFLRVAAVRDVHHRSLLRLDLPVPTRTSFVSSPGTVRAGPRSSGSCGFDQLIEGRVETFVDELLIGIRVVPAENLASAECEGLSL